MVATLDLLKRAAAAKRNFIVVHEPTFYSGAEDEFHARNNAEDPLVQLKRGLHREQRAGGVAIPRSLARAEARRDHLAEWAWPWDGRSIR